MLFADVLAVAVTEAAIGAPKPNPTEGDASIALETAVVDAVAVANEKPSFAGAVALLGRAAEREDPKEKVEGADLPGTEALALNDTSPVSLASR
jgi:hypothetical protein